jgi:beta-glucosidase
VRPPATTPRGWRTSLVAVLLAAALTPLVALAPTRALAAPVCPWIAAALAHRASPGRLADEVARHLSIAQAAGLVVLTAQGHLENVNSAVPGLCVPALTLTDGPVGVGSGLRGVTQFPSEVAVAASFDPSLAHSLGAAMGAETRAKGLDVLQGPNLNLTRVPTNGRVFETYGEDPTLASAMGVAAIRGIQSTGTLADAKHFTAYTQETARGIVNQIVSARALAELYDVPFAAAVREAHVASVMCAMGAINGVNACSDPALYARLRAWGFRGFVRSDYLAVVNPVRAFAAGLDLIKPGSAAALVAAVRDHRLSAAALRRASADVLRTMFAWGLMTHPRYPNLGAATSTRSHQALALSAAEEGAVLLKNRGALPLSAGLRSVAVIGVDAQANPITRGGGSSEVTASTVITPLAGLRADLGSSVRVTYSPGGRPVLELDQLRFSDLLAGRPLPHLRPLSVEAEPGKSDLAIDYAKGVTAAAATAAQPGHGEGWSRWRVRLRVRVGGTYEVGLQQTGDTWLTLDGRPLISSPGLHGPTVATTTVGLRAHHVYSLEARWFAVSAKTMPKLGLTNVSGYIASAAAAARRAQVAVVFASAYSTEGADQSSLALPGDSNALIAAVARANPHTVVVLNTAGAVAMPWLSSVRAVLEAWYPGQADGAAVAALLTGRVDPSGRLPVTFPTDAALSPVATAAAFPGVKSNVTFGGLDIGYRWYQSHHVRPLFPFGYGLSYTTFSLGSATLTTSSGRATVTLTVRNTGSRPGTCVVQAYLHYPAGNGEPPEQLRAFTRVSLAAGANHSVSLDLTRSGFALYRDGHWRVPRGAFRIDVGTSSASTPIDFALSAP